MTRDLQIDHSVTMDGSRALLDRAKNVIPGGVSSYARKFDLPVSFERGEGSRVYDVDGNEYVDYLNAWGAISLGHCHPDVNAAAARALETQDLYGMGTTDLEVELAEAVSEHVPSAERVLFGLSGSSMVASAIRLARAVTGGRKIVKFQGHYHGWYDPLALNHESGSEDIGTKDPFTAGVLPDVFEDTIVLPFNDIDAVEETFAEHGDDIAAVILEPIAHNMGCVLPKDGYLDALREITDDHDSLLIFDEIVTGFRHNMGGAQALFDVTPDLTTMGKSVANGYPLSILCGTAEYMERFQTADGGDVAFGGTYNAHAGATAAALETIRIMETDDVHERAATLCEEAATGIEDVIDDLGITAQVRRYGTVFLTYFMDGPIDDYEDVLRNDTETYLAYRLEMINRGVLMVPKDARRNYLTASHTEEDVQRTIEAAEGALRTVADDA